MIRVYYRVTRLCQCYLIYTGIHPHIAKIIHIYIINRIYIAHMSHISNLTIKACSSHVEINVTINKNNLLFWWIFSYFCFFFITILKIWVKNYCWANNGYDDGCYWYWCWVLCVVLQKIMKKKNTHTQTQNSY